MLKPNYKKAAKVYEDAVNQWADSVELSICYSANKSRFYGYANFKLKNKLQIPPLETPGGLASSDTEKAECLNDFFQSVFKVDDGNDLFLDDKLPASQFMFDLIITREDIMMSVCNLADKLSNTPDGILSYF